MIDYDPMKDDENQRRRGLPLALAELLFDGPSSKRRIVAVTMTKRASSEDLSRIKTFT